MDAAAIAHDLFFTRAGMDEPRTTALLGEAFKGAEDGELFLEYRQSEALSFDDGRIKSTSFDVTQGFGLRVVVGESTGYAHASDLSEGALKRAVGALGAVRRGANGQLALGPSRTNHTLYPPDNPLDDVPLAEKVALLEAIDAYARTTDSKVRQVMASLAGEWQVVMIERPDGARVSDVRPLGVPSSSTVSEPRRPAIVPSSTTVTPSAATRLPKRPANAEVFLRLKSPSRPWPIASCSKIPGQPGPSTTVISPAGAGIDSRLTSA